MECIICKKKFHHCGSCEYDPVRDAGYCDWECMEKDINFNNAQKVADFMKQNNLDFNKNVDIEVVEAIVYGY